MRTRERAIALVLAMAMAAACHGDPPSVDLDGGHTDDASEPAADADASSVDAKLEQSLTSDAERDATDAAPPDPRDVDLSCQVCSPPGGQYCGFIGERCTRRTLNCGSFCNEPGFTCGGGGRANVCGAARDSGICAVTSCQTAAARYCGPIGDGCGNTIECADCPLPMICGASGLPGVCGIPEGMCTRLMCGNAAGHFCGVIGDGCGGILDCGSCPNGDACGVAIPHVCGSDPPGILVPPPAPVPPPPPAPPTPTPPPPD